MTLRTLNTATNTLSLLRRHRIVHVVFLHLAFFVALFLAAHVFGGHARKVCGGDGAGEDADAEVGIGLLAQVLAEAAEFEAVGVVGCRLGVGEGEDGGFDRFGDGEDFGGGFGGVHYETVV